MFRLFDLLTKTYWFSNLLTCVNLVNASSTRN